ncbi:MAG TPA: energy transducer TonB [Desulfobacteraceae bacterium]|nr:energy transducer TonB [Desulfobacteraceae bacterium]HPQ28803.1 energy transducer TonB [Desulfobacteraceae bacterium]
MKRVLLAAVIAVSIHASVLFVPPFHLGQMSPPVFQPQIVTLNLCPIQPQTKEDHLVHEEIPKLIKKTIESRRPVKQKNSEDFPRSKNHAKVSIKPVKKETVKNLPENASFFGSEPAPEIQPENDFVQPFDYNEEFSQDAPLKENSVKTTSPQTISAVREARPIYKINPPPEYPLSARRRGYQGTVILEVLVDRHGRVKDQRISESSGHDVLDRAAVSSVENWVFEPGIRGDEKTEMWVKIPIRFQLLDD